MKTFERLNMNKFVHFFTLALLMLSLVACNNKPTPPDPGNSEDPEIDDPTIPSTMKLFINGMGEITKDQTITLHEAEEQLSGKMQMALNGTIEGVEKVRVIVTRSVEGREDEFCALGTCAPGDGQLEQEFNFSVIGGAKTWFAHYTLPESGDTEYTVNYKFINYSRVITVTVVYDYQKLD